MNTTYSNSSNVWRATLLSLVIPGAGQFSLGKRERGGVILGTLVVLAALIQWALATYKIGMLMLGHVNTSWLWGVLVLFWLWNVFDANRLARQLPPFTLLGLLLSAVIIYYIGWQVTDINVSRLVSRFSDAQTVFRAIVQPDLFEQDAITGQWRPSENFGDIIGKVADKPAPAWMVNLGLAQKGQLVPTPLLGKLAETIAIGLMATLFSTLFAIPLSFLAARNIMARLPGGVLIYYVMRTILNVVRSIDTIIWGVIVVVWVGLGSFAGVLALTIHSIAALGKLYSEEIEHIDPGPIEAITATGANLLQVIRYAVIPQIVPPFLAYTLLRWDINMRMATVVGFVAGGGIGFFVLETIRKGGYEQYAAALWAVAVVIIIVDYVSAKWRERILVGETKVTTAPKPFYTSPRSLVYALLLLALFVASWHLAQIDFGKMFEPAPTFWRLVGDFVTIDLNPDVLEVVIRQMITTVFQALLATTLGGLLAIPFSFLAARNLMGGNKLGLLVYYFARGALNVLRSIEALLYVAIFVFWVGIGPFAGMLALAVTTFALIGKLFSEAIENIDPGPVEAIAATGANRLQQIVYAILPQIIPPFISYLIYQWDINVRISTIVGFAGGGGIGLLLNTYFGKLQYHKAGTVVAVIVLVVTLMDFASAKIRQRLV